MLALLLAAPAFAQSDTDYVRARVADAAGLAGPASAGYSAALKARPDDAILAMRAYRQALMAGDYALASRAAATLVRAGSAPPDTALLAFAVALKTGDRTATDAALVRLQAGPLNFMAPVLAAWLAAERGEDAMAPLAQGSGNVLVERFADKHRPLLASARPGKSVAAAGAARLFTDVAEDIAEQDISVLSILLTRAALLLDPAADRARLYLAEALSKSGQNRLALAELAKVAVAGPYRRDAQATRIAVLQRTGEFAQALPLAKSLAEGRESTADDARLYGDVLTASAQFAAAAKAYAIALSRTGGDGGWELNYLLGSALDRAGQWDKALPALKRAVELGPNQADALEYLGNAQITRGVNLAGAQALLERASKLNPDDASIAASLGWAYYVQGDIPRALPLLEAAVQGDPSGVMPNEHLGDAYWQLGRKYEARYAWSIAGLYADDDALERIKGKLAKGL